MKKVLISQQSTISHYRVPLYNALERLRPDTWCFDVVFDHSELKTPRFFKEPLDINEFKFPTLDTKTFTIKGSGKRISYQTFWLQAATYDLIIVEHAVHNLAYPLCQIHQIAGVKFAYWGHDTDRIAGSSSVLKKIIERLKIQLAYKANGFFAYTPGVKQNLEHQGLSSLKIFAVNNTIDINKQRTIFRKWCVNREAIRQELGLEGKNVLLFVGRLTKSKRLDFLLESFAMLRNQNTNFHLLLVGDSADFSSNMDTKNITYLGPIVELDKLGPIYVASDLFVITGAVGLGPLQAFCYNLPSVAIDLSTNGPEVEYLSPKNSILLDSSATPEVYAQTLLDLFSDANRLSSLKVNAWPSIKHLTIDQMALNFIEGINSLLTL